jgi:hypothetical protein
MRKRLSCIALATMFLLPATFALAQTPEPAAGNPAIDNTPKPSSGSGVTSGLGNSASPSMASPSNEANIPKGSNPNGASGNLGAGSGATPSSTASDDSMPSQTGPNAQSGINDSRPQTATKPDNAAGNEGQSPSPANNAGPMPQGQYTSPPTTDPK